MSWCVFFYFASLAAKIDVHGADPVWVPVGMYGSGMSIKNTFASGAAATSFGCKSPVG